MPDDCKGHCPEHKENTDTISTHSGMWKVLLGFAALYAVILGLQYQAVGNIETLATKMDKTFTSHMAISQQKIAGINRRLDNCDTADHDHEIRIRELERR